MLVKYIHGSGKILPKANRDCHDHLIDLICTVDNHVICHKWKEDDERIVFRELPTKVKALVIYKKYYIQNELSTLSKHENICVECTLLGEKGRSMLDYENALFGKNPIRRHIGNSNYNLIVDNLS